MTDFHGGMSGGNDSENNKEKNLVQFMSELLNQKKDVVDITLLRRYFIWVIGIGLKIELKRNKQN